MTIGISEASRGNKTTNSVLLKYAKFVLNNDGLTPADADREIATYLDATAHETLINDVIRWITYLKKNYSPASVHLYYSTVRSYWRRNSVYVSENEQIVISGVMPHNVIVTEDDFLTVKKIKSILSYADPMLKAYVLMLCSSGCRPGELRQLTPDDLKYDEENDINYFKLRYNQTKNNKPHTYYFSHEAREAVNAFEKIKPDYIAQSKLKTSKCLKKGIPDVEHLLFPFSETTLNIKLENALKKSGLYNRDDNTDRITIHPHSFRKFADTTFKEIVGVNMGNELIGHDEGLSTSYRRYDPLKVIEAYKKCEPHVTIMAPVDYVHLKTESQTEILKLQGILANQQAQIQSITEELEALHMLKVLTGGNDKKTK